MVISSQSKLIKITPLTLQIDNIIIENVNCQKILGVYVGTKQSELGSPIYSYLQTT